MAKVSESSKNFYLPTHHQLTTNWRRFSTVATQMPNEPVEPKFLTVRIYDTLRGSLMEPAIILIETVLMACLAAIYLYDRTEVRYWQQQAYRYQQLYDKLAEQVASQHRN